ncbi:MAG: chorismate synthase [Clostridiales bacterium]|jgi:chorismate synthase|nr:chorismate synthase [Clostridiales bacterium]
MSGSRFGKNFTVTTWGESHGPAIGAVVDGCPAGVALSEEDIQRDLDRRSPGRSPYASKRVEPDTAVILSGVFNGVTTGTPVSILINNADKRTADYSDIAGVYRPGHADYTYDKKYGIRDYRGGGRSSGRETACRVAGGAVARRFLGELGVDVQAYTVAIGSTSVDRARFDMSQVTLNPLCMPDRQAYERAAAETDAAMKEGNSLGGVVECVIRGVPPGVGEPVFDKLSALLARAVCSINAVKGFEMGAGFNAAGMKGTENNDEMYYENGALKKRTNNAGGIYGGIADGSDIVFRAAFKPTPSISAAQNTVGADGANRTLRVKGRHDPLVVPRAVVVVEAMAALTVADLTLQACLSNILNIKKILDVVK